VCKFFVKKKGKKQISGSSRTVLGSPKSFPVDVKVEKVEAKTIRNTFRK
jgi:hypothetical protein